MTGGDGGVPAFRTLEDYVYLGLLPQIVRVGGDAQCAGTFGKGRRED